MNDQLINVVIAGLGGQGVLKAADILAEAALRTGQDVKKSEIRHIPDRLKLKTVAEPQLK